jgi:hypothetical protein
MVGTFGFGGAIVGFGGGAIIGLDDGAMFGWPCEPHP